jgi:hypothetical protein
MYITAFVVLVAFAVAVNYLGGSSMDPQNWARQNGLIRAMLPTVIAPLVFWRTRWVQIAAPSAFLILLVVVMVLFSEVLR